MSEEGCGRPRFQAQLKKDYQVYVPMNVIDESGASPGDYLTLEVVPAHEGRPRPCAVSHELEAKSRMDEVDEIGQSTFNHYLPLWIHNFKEHMRLTSGRSVDSVNNIETTNRGGKAIVVGAGPSLDVYDLRAMRGWEGIIVATNKALIPLLEEGVVPHWVVALDGEPVVMKSFDSQVVRDAEGLINFMGPTVLSPEVTEFVLDWAGNCYWGNPHMPSGGDSDKWNINVVLELMNGLPLMHHGGNVGTCAWLLAKKLGSDPISMLGFDLCDYPNPSWTRPKVIDYEFFYNPDNGETIALNGPFRAYTNILLNAFDLGWNEEPPTRTVNSTPRGALHMSGFVPNIPLYDFLSLPSDEIISRATSDRNEVVERMAKRVEIAREAQKPIFKDVV